MDVLLSMLPLALLVFGWLGPAVWMYRDAGRRVVRPARAGQAFLAAAAFPLLAPLAWLLLRPHETLDERRDLELERAYLERMLETEERCVACRTQVASSFLCCPRCGTSLRRRCDSCSEPIEFGWSFCPYCSDRADRAARVTRLAMPAEEGRRARRADER
jgi:hypothetical protein